MKCRADIVRRIGVLLAMIGIPAIYGCQSPLPNRNPTGDAFPPVTGRDLEDSEIVLPLDLAGTPALVLVGYVQGTQFDIDRWMLGMIQSESDLKLVEVPAVGGWFPELFLQPTIDEGMKAGIPAENWSSVVTLYGEDAERVRRFTGTQRPRNARVMLLDTNGSVAWFWDQGYSPTRLVQMLEVAASAE